MLMLMMMMLVPNLNPKANTLTAAISQHCNNKFTIRIHLNPNFADGSGLLIRFGAIIREVL